MLRVENISKKFAENAALKPMSLDFVKGSTTAFLGPSGCGKSTLLRIVMGLIPPDTGDVILDGDELNSGNVLRFRHRMGYMIQDGGLFPHLTVRENVSLVGEHLKWEPSRLDDRCNELQKLVDLPKETLERFPNEISGGQRQRVALMRALFLDPQVLLLDEPMGALDPLIRSDLQSELRQIFKTLGKTVVVVTHDIAEAGFLASRIVLMKEGSIAQVGSLKELVKQPAEPFVSDFINAQRSPLDSLEVQ